MLTDPYAIYAAAQHYWRAAFSLFTGRIPLSAPQRTFDYLGVPELSPAYTFGILPCGPPNTRANSEALVQAIRDEFHDPAPARPPEHSSSALETIAVDVVAQRRYVITLEGTQPLNGHVDYHLQLRPNNEPGTYRLRDMWVDTATYATDRVVTDGNFTSPGLTDVHWRIDYVQKDGVPYITSETALSPVTLDRRHYEAATVSFSALRSAANPDTLSSLRRFSVDASSAPPPLIEPTNPRR